MRAARRVAVFTHRRPQDTRAALERLVSVAEREGVELRFDAEETRKHGIEARDGVVVECAPDLAEDVDLVVALGGDGTILGALRRYAGRRVPVFGLNFGEIGFLATLDPDDEDGGFERALAGDFDLLSLPGIAVKPGGDGDGPAFAINDVSVTRRPGERVAVLSYGLAGEEVGAVRCDGLVVSTPAGSTGYNLANGGPVLAWGVEGMVVSFIAPHSLTARALVTAPDDPITIQNRSREEPVDVAVDGRPLGCLEPGAELECRFVDGVAQLAQVPGSSFYRRLREKFGRLAT